MFFTKDDYQKIKDYLLELGIKDSEFPELDNITGKEYIAIVGEDGTNKKISTLNFLDMMVTNFGGREFLEGGILTVNTLDDLETFAAKIHGNLVYVRDLNSYYAYSKTDEWQQILKIYIGSTEPEDSSVLWIDLDDNSLPNEEDEYIAVLNYAIRKLLNRVKLLEKIITVGVVAGDVTNSYRQDLMEDVDPEKPYTGEEELPEEETAPILEEEINDYPVKPEDTSLAEPTVNSVCAKKDTAANFSRNRANLVDGEMLFYTDKHRFAIYYGGNFYTIQSGGGTGGSGNGISLEDLYDSQLDYLVFNDGSKNYKARVNSDGKWTVTEYTNNVISVGSPNSNENYISHLLSMNEIYCGGESVNEECSCSHSFVELANGSWSDINLNGIYLLYTDGTMASQYGYNWKVLPLEGVIKAGSTFLIRGARCNTDKGSFIPVDSYDMEWYDGDSLIQFKQGGAAFYLCAGTSFREALDAGTLLIPWKNTTSELPVGYIDSCGFGSFGVTGGTPKEGTTNFDITEDWNKLLFIRWFMLDPSKQANKAVTSRKTPDLWTYINLDKQTTVKGNIVNNGSTYPNKSKQYYYPDEIKQLYTPKASYLNKTFFTNKTSFNSRKPNMINITFGTLATDNGAGATRCFNWVSVGNYDEYIEYKKTTETTWTRVYSITADNASNPSYITQFIDHYKRFRWRAADGTLVTTHKCIIKGLTAANYQYRVGRDGDNSYTSDVYAFRVHANSEVTSFNFIQDTDLQGFNWQEYTAWKKTADTIATEDNINFTINTGDITQSGNRPNEWIDYYYGREALRDKEEMFTIGNNDLCGHVSTELTDGNDNSSKYNHINILRYYTFELDPQNEYSFTYNGNTYPIYSLYSFNYGQYHFVSLNSEIAIATSKMYYDWQSDTAAGDLNFAKAANALIEDWFKKDLQIWKNLESNVDPTNCGKCIVYMHEMPFTIVTYDFMNKASSARVGSHLNTLNERGNYRFSRIFKKYGIKLVLGGHKHTFCITKPIYDAPAGYITNNNTVDANVDLMGTVGTDESRKPVIQIPNDATVPDNMANFARYEKVSNYNAPTYVMSQASGYKLVSNKEQPSGDAYTIPWLLAYFKAATNSSSPTENLGLHRPMYVRYAINGNNNTVTITVKLVLNVWTIYSNETKKKFDMNALSNNIEATAMTLSLTSSADMELYAPDNNNNVTSYTITL